ncbi:Alpha-latroinsectotoxin-Lt1a [Bienertia sinuspersici]
MVKKNNIACYRERLDETLAAENLIDEKILKALVKDQISRSSENKSGDYIDDITAKRTPEVSMFLEMLRSASENYSSLSHETHHASWKVSNPSA